MNYKQPCKKTKQLKRVRVTSDFAISLLSVTAFYRFFYSCNQINDLCTYWNKTYHLVLSALPQYVTKYTAVNINNFFISRISMRWNAERDIVLLFLSVRP